MSVFAFNQPALSKQDTPQAISDNNTLVAEHSSQSEKLLKRRAYFGIGGESKGDDLGVTITFVDKQSTADAMGVKLGDKVLRINQKSMRSMTDIVEIAANTKGGNSLIFEVERDGKTLLLSAKAQERAREKVDGLEIEYTEVAINEGNSRLIVYRPADASENKRYPVLFYLQGFSCASVDFGGTGDNPIRRFAEDIAKAGYVVVRQEKHGVGDSVSDISCNLVNFPQEASAFVAGFNKLVDLPYVESNEIFLFGHSLGASVAIAIAENQQKYAELQNSIVPKGIISYGAVGRRWIEYSYDVLTEQPKVLGQNLRKAKRKAKYVYPFLRDLMTSTMSWEAMVSAHPKVFMDRLYPAENEMVLYRHYSFLRSLNQFDIENAWKNYQGDVLALHGTMDVHVISDKDAKLIASSVNNESEKRGTFLAIEGAEHGLSKPEIPLDEYTKKLRFGKWRASDALNSYDPRIAAAAVDWMNERITRS